MDWKIIVCSLVLLVVGTEETIRYYIKVKDGSHTELPRLIFYCCAACSGVWSTIISLLWR